MTHPEQSGELQQLREQLAQLTRRVYRLEELLRSTTPQTTVSEQSTVISTVTSQTARAPEPGVISAEATKSLPASETPAQVTTAFSSYVSEQEKPKPGLEARIGGQWLNRVGIVAVLVGSSYFLKLAFDNNWIGPATQVLVGIVAGLGVLFWSERFRRNGYAGFAYSLKAVAVGALYLSLWAASQYYHLVPPSVAFFGMVMVTLMTAGLSLRQNAELLAALALLGGFLTPVLVSTGENHPFALFCYLALLDLGTLWVVSINGWHRLLLGSFAGTATLFGAWASSYYNESQLAIGLGFATFFFLLYAGAPFLHRRDSGNPTSAIVLFTLAVLNAGFYFATSYLMLVARYRDELAWLSFGIAVLFFVMARLLQKTGTISRAEYAPLHLALGIGFLTIALPLKLDGYWITLGWLVEAGALFGASRAGRGLLLRLLGTVALVLGVARLIAVDSFDRTTLLVNPRFGLYMVAIAALAVLAYNTRGGSTEVERQWCGAAIIAMNILALLALHFEIIQYFQPQFGAAYSEASRQTATTLRDFTYSTVWMLYGSGLMLMGFWRRSAFLRWQAIVLLAATAAKVFLFDISTLERGYRIVAFIVLGAILLAVSFFYQRSRTKSSA